MKNRVIYEKKNNVVINPEEYLRVNFFNFPEEIWNTKERFNCYTDKQF